MLAMVGLVAVGLVVAGAGGLILTRNAARNDAKARLVSEVQSLTSPPAGTQFLRNLGVIRRVLRLEDADFVRINRLGTVKSRLPDGLTPQDLDVSTLQGGQSISGRRGNLVYAAAPVTLSAAERARLKNFEGTLAILLTQNVGGLGPSWGYFIVAGGAALLIAALVAWQMSRRMARPLVEAMEATGRIASGDFESRVPIRGSDYPEFSNLASSINDMAQRLEDGRTRERHLLLAVSHDLRTPLTSIRGFAEAIKDGAIEDDDEAADVIIAESRRLERLVGDLLDLTKLEARQMSINVRPTDAAEVAGTTAEGFRPAAARNGLQIVTELPDDDSEALVAADPDRLAQLLANLLENAITFARSTVRVTVTDGVGACVVTVDDDGPGIAEGDLVRVFERFYRADRGPNRRFGSGLGLAIVAELAGAMGGTVRAESPISDHGGSRFILTLRRWPQPVPEPVPT
jgi:signal transduction histidine kinase